MVFQADIRLLLGQAMGMSPGQKAGDGLGELLALVQQCVVGIQQQVCKERTRQSLQDHCRGKLHRERFQRAKADLQHFGEILSK